MIRNGFIKTINSGWFNLRYVRRLWVDQLVNEKYAVACVFESHAQEGFRFSERVGLCFDTKEEAEKFLDEMMCNPFP
jgi:hypothetical protein